MFAWIDIQQDEALNRCVREIVDATGFRTGLSLHLEMTENMVFLTFKPDARRDEQTTIVLHVSDEPRLTVDKGCWMVHYPHYEFVRQQLGAILNLIQIGVRGEQNSRCFTTR